MLSKSIKIPSRLFMSKTAKAPISTAACLIIGDEVLNGKIFDTNSNYFAKYCFDLGISLKSIQVVADDKNDIKENILRLHSRYDFIVTSGGIGPTHDDITYESLAEAFGLPLEHNQETIDKMKRLSKVPFESRTAEAQEAQLRMALLPAGSNVRNIYISDDLWVPIVQINEKIHVLPGIPQLFKRLLEGIKPEIASRVDESRKQVRYYVKTHTRESDMAPFLSAIQKRVDPYNISIGSYPHMKLQTNTVSIIGYKKDAQILESLVKEIEQGVKGEQISVEEEASASSEK